MNKKISVIVAVYNTEKYVEKCLSSLLNQTYQNIELIMLINGKTKKEIFNLLPSSLIKEIFISIDFMYFSYLYQSTW